MSWITNYVHEYFMRVLERENECKRITSLANYKGFDIRECQMSSYKIKICYRNSHAFKR